MSYEYSAASGRFEIANPYRIENIARFASGAFAAIVGLTLLVRFREAMASTDTLGLRGVAAGLVLLAVGLGAIGFALAQLRYYFGRGRPADLSNLDSSSGGQPAERAQWLKENLRQNALAYSEPRGPVSNLVHHVFESLIFAPRQVRWAAEAQASNTLLVVAILLGLMATMLFYPNSTMQSWLALLYLLILAPKLIRPMGKGRTTFQPVRTGVGFMLLIVSIPILAPPLLDRIAPSLPTIDSLHVPRTLGICLIILALCQTAFFLALMRQLGSRPAVNMACVQRSMCMNGNPSKLFEELERVLQSRWVEGVPNRSYSRINLPDVFSGQSGSFAGESLEETQPVPIGAGSVGSLSEHIRSERVAPISFLTLLGMLVHAGATIAVAIFALSSIGSQEAWATAFLAVCFYAVARYSFSSAHMLWGRVDFQSNLIWLEINGSFEEAQINVGSQFTSAMSSSKKIVNVESMTLRVWAAELDSVIFGKDGARDLVGMRGRPDLAEFYAGHLEAFAAELASVVAPSSQADRARIALMAHHQLAASSAPPPLPELAPLQSMFAPGTGVMCRNPSCGSALAVQSRFCGACGQPVSA